MLTSHKLGQNSQLNQHRQKLVNDYYCVIKRRFIKPSRLSLAAKLKQNKHKRTHNTQHSPLAKLKHNKLLLAAGYVKPTSHQNRLAHILTNNLLAGLTVGYSLTNRHNIGANVAGYVITYVNNLNITGVWPSARYWLTPYKPTKPQTFFV